ncbi:hypothetical protein A2153_03760 [Candidatus Gottesmanbacteria bacterium RBG_16_38_7b]|uniref:Uncharacterized protein n=1 Tax=Candidatus Gottesmanbacteria bacterium RBG_16_38_7b TaxID=1798372 RepID=A0A1F5YHH5_9BACT|nr:MAG: hypothetical protein A2153_03760 [Candidatus Gottesmanbacteria bacterium RBG_16_38_7b]
MPQAVISQGERSFVVEGKTLPTCIPNIEPNIRSPCMLRELLKTRIREPEDSINWHSGARLEVVGSCNNCGQTFSVTVFEAPIIPQTPPA